MFQAALQGPGTAKQNPPHVQTLADCAGENLIFKNIWEIHMILLYINIKVTFVGVMVAAEIIDFHQWSQ